MQPSGGDDQIGQKTNGDGQGQQTFALQDGQELQIGGNTYRYLGNGRIQGDQAPAPSNNLRGADRNLNQGGAGGGGPDQAA